MFAWLAEHGITILALTVVLALILVAVFSLLKERKRPTGGCTGNCASCRMGCGQAEKKES